jgi:hypothetical protein
MTIIARRAVARLSLVTPAGYPESVPIKPIDGSHRPAGGTTAAKSMKLA